MRRLDARTSNTLELEELGGLLPPIAGTSEVLVQESGLCIEGVGRISLLAGILPDPRKFAGVGRGSAWPHLLPDSLGNHHKWLIPDARQCGERRES